MSEIDCQIHGEGCLHCGEACRLEHQIWTKKLAEAETVIERAENALEMVVERFGDGGIFPRKGETWIMGKEALSVIRAWKEGKNG